MLYILCIATQCIACTVTICILINSYAVNALGSHQNCVFVHYHTVLYRQCVQVWQPLLLVHIAVPNTLQAQCVCAYESCMISIWSCSVCAECVGALFDEIESNRFCGLESCAKFICGFIVCESDHSESISSSSDGFERCDILSRERADILSCELADILLRERADILLCERADILSCERADILSRERADILSCERAGILSRKSAGILSCERADILSCERAGILSRKSAGILSRERADILSCERAKFICGFIVCESDHSESITSSSDGFERCDILSRERAGFTENTPVECGSLENTPVESGPL